MSMNEHDHNEQNEQADEDFGFFNIYSAQLLYRTPPTIDRDILYAKVQEYTGPLHTIVDDEGTEQESLAVWEANPTDDVETEVDPKDYYHFSILIISSIMKMQTCLYKRCLCLQKRQFKWNPMRLLYSNHGTGKKLRQWLSNANMN